MESSWAHFSGDVPLSWPQPVSLFPQLCARLCLGGNLKYEMEIHWSWQLQRGERGWSLACLFGVQATPLISGSGCPKRQEGKERENCSERSGRRRHGMGSRKARIQRCAFPCKGRRVGGSAALQENAGWERTPCTQSFSELRSHDPKGPWPRHCFGWGSESPVMRLDDACQAPPGHIPPQLQGSPEIAKMTGRPSD